MNTAVPRCPEAIVVSAGIPSVRIPGVLDRNG